MAGFVSENWRRMFNRKIYGISHGDQLVIAIGLTVFLVLSSAYFWWRSETNNGLIEFQDLPSREAVFEVDLNSAAWPEFSNLPGIGEKLAKQIVAHRQEFGPFESTDQLKEVSGIGPAKLEAILPFISVSAATDENNGVDK